jgi:hypothetical protein
MERERAIHQQEKDVLMSQIKDLQEELLSVKASVCCKQLALQYCWDMHGRARLKRDGTRAETRFRLSEKRTSPFESAGVLT